MRSDRRNNAFAPVGEVLQGYLKNLGLESQLKEAELLALWKDIAGPQVAQFTQAESFKKGILFVKVANHVWLQHLGFFKETFLQKLNERLGERVVEKVFFKCGRISTRPQAVEETASAPPTLKPLSASETQEIEQIVTPLKDEELKALLKTFLTKVWLHENLHGGDKPYER